MIEKKGDVMDRWKFGPPAKAKTVVQEREKYRSDAKTELMVGSGVKVGC